MQWLGLVKPCGGLPVQSGLQLRMSLILLLVDGLACRMYNDLRMRMRMSFQYFNTESDLHQRRGVKTSGLALMGLVVTIGIVAERRRALRYLLCRLWGEMVHGRYRKALRCSARMANIITIPSSANLLAFIVRR